jgi:hypothetical protein
MGAPDGGNRMPEEASLPPTSEKPPRGARSVDPSDVLGVHGLVAAVCMHYGLTHEQLRSRRRAAGIVRARAVLCYWGVVRLGLLGRSIAEVLDITRGGVSAALERGRRIAIEDGFQVDPPRGRRSAS